jgi:hypothetical protein
MILQSLVKKCRIVALDFFPRQVSHRCRVSDQREHRVHVDRCIIRCYDITSKYAMFTCQCHFILVTSADLIVRVCCDPSTSQPGVYSRVFTKCPCKHLGTRFEATNALFSKHGRHETYWDIFTNTL